MVHVLLKPGLENFEHYFTLLACAAAAAAKSCQSCPTLCNSTDGSPSSSAIPGILQARTLEWVAISFFSAWKWKVKVKLVSRIWLFMTPWTATYEAPLSMGFSRQEYWSGLPLPSLLPRVRWVQLCGSLAFFGIAFIWAFFGIAFLWAKRYLAV